MVAGVEMGAVTTAFVSAGAAGETAVSVVFVGFCGSTKVGGSTNVAGTAVAREKRRGEGPICFK